MTIEISPSTGVTTLINVFTVEPERQEAALAILEGAVAPVRRMPGFISTAFHVSLDGERVVNYAQWESREAIEAMLANPECAEHIEQLRAVSTADPRVYEVRSTHAGLGDDPA